MSFVSHSKLINVHTLLLKIIFYPGSYGWILWVWKSLVILLLTSPILVNQMCLTIDEQNWIVRTSLVLGSHSELVWLEYIEAV